MPQQHLFGHTAIVGLTISVKLNAHKPGGRIDVAVLDEQGKATERQSVMWVKDRDVSDLGTVLKEVANAFLWGEHTDVSRMLVSSSKVHMPKVPPAGQP